MLSRNHPEVDGGWLCDKGRFAFGHLYARDRITAPLRKAGPRRFEQLTWEDALDRLERLLRDAGSAVVTALSGGESVEQAYALGKLLRGGLGAHAAVLPEDVPDRLDAWRAPLSSIRSARRIAVLTDEPVVERAPVVDLWLKEARRRGAEIVYAQPEGAVDVLVTDVAERAEAVDAGEVFYLPRTPNGRGIADAWSAAADGEPSDVQPRLLLVSGDEAATDPSVRALAAQVETVVGIGMFEESFRAFADLVLPGTSYLERDGTVVNLEGRLQRQRRTVPPPCPAELTWLAQLAQRFEVEVSPHVPAVFAEVSARCFGGIAFGDVGEVAELPGRAEQPGPETPELSSRSELSSSGSGLRLVAYRPLFSGAAVERTPELQFQRPQAEVQLAREDARARGIRNGQSVTVSSNGTSLELRARIAADLAAGTVRIPREHAGDLHATVEVTA